MIRWDNMGLTAVILAATAWVSGCEERATEPAAPTPAAPRPTTVTVTPPAARLAALGATVQLAAEVRDQNGQPMAGSAVTWASGAAAVATVDAAGLVTAVGNGTATIVATAGSASGTAAVTVAQEVSAVTVTPSADTLVVGDTLRLAAEATDANGHLVTGAEFAWASSDALLATVDTTGLVTGVGAGEVALTATSSGVVGRAALTVLARVSATVTVEPDSLLFSALGDTVRLLAEVRDQIGRVMVGAPVSWASGDTLVASVDSAGLVTAVGNGAARVTAAADEATGQALVTVVQSVRSVVVTPPTVTTVVGDTLRLVAEAFDANAHAVEGAEFSWSTSDPSVARVDGTGLVLGIAEGAATIADATARATTLNRFLGGLVMLRAHQLRRSGLSWESVSRMVRFARPTLTRKSRRWPGCTLRELECMDPDQLFAAFNETFARPLLSRTGQE